MVRGVRIVKVVGAVVRGKGTSRVISYLLLLTSYLYLRLQPGTWSTAEIALKAEHRPSVFPGDGGEGDGAANAVEVHHQQRPPLATLILDDTALMDVRTSGSILVGLGDTESCSVMADAVLLTLRHLRQRCCMVAEGLIGSDGDGLIGSPDALRTAAEGAAIRTVVSRYKIVHAIDLIYVVTLADSTALGDNRALSLLNGTTHVGLQFGTLHLTISMDGIDLPIVVEEYAEVIDTPLHVMMLPWPADILGGVALQAFAVDVGKDIELAVCIAYGGCPDALTVDLLMILQREGIIREVETVEAVGDILPVHEIL